MTEIAYITQGTHRPPSNNDICDKVFKQQLATKHVTICINA